MEEINAVVKPLVDSAVGATEKAGSALVDAGETALGAVVFVLTAGVGKTADEAHDTVQPKSDSTGSPEPATAAGGAGARQGGGTITGFTRHGLNQAISRDGVGVSNRAMLDAMPVPYADLHNPQTLNLYDYVGSDPTNHADADGHRDYAQSNSGNPCYNTASAECAAAKKAQKQVIYTYQGDHVLVTNVSTTTVANKDGTTTETKILTSAAFSTKKGQEGQFIGAGSETITRVKDDVGAVMSKTSSGWSDIGYGQAAQAIGANNLAQGVAYATPGPEHFFPQVWKDIQHHPLGTLGIVVRSAAIPVGVACPWCGIGMAIGGEALATADSAKDATPYP